MIAKKLLQKHYLKQGKSQQEIADRLKCALNTVAYWMNKHDIKRRSIEQAVYLRNNPDGDPFKFSPPHNLRDARLFGLGLGLYWGEGNKANRYSVRIGNTDPLLIKRFMEFLQRFFGIKKTALRFSLQIFSDIYPQRALSFWQKNLRVSPKQFMRTTVTKARSIGNYKHKNLHGVLTLYFHNKKLRNLIISLLQNI